VETQGCTQDIERPALDNQRSLDIVMGRHVG
jgi:hypothetical protein